MEKAANHLWRLRKETYEPGDEGKGKERRKKMFSPALTVLEKGPPSRMFRNAA